MSRARTAKYTLSLLALATSTACASSPDAARPSAEDVAFQEAIEEALQPATAEEKAQANRSDPITRANFWANEYQKDGLNLETTIEFMRALRNIGSHERILEIATTTIPAHPQSHEIFLELGRSFMAQAKYDQASQAFVRSADLAPTTEATPLAALGLAFDRLEQHDKAQQAYQYALDRDPNRATTLSNYGLSLALTGQLEAAEATLRRAVEAPGSDVRVRQNLALVLGLQGRFDEMVAVDPNAPPRSIEANQRALREMMTPVNNYDGLRSLDEVIDTLERTPAAAQSMPEVPEVRVDAESMQDPLSAANVAGTDPELAGEGPQPVTQNLRPTLRGSQGR
ncbi:MAG: tetratricopeptide repeat protein [Pseudomonadota bacterium]